MVAGEPMYYVLSQFLETDDNVNVATVLKELVVELRELRKVLTAQRAQPSS